MNPFLTDIQTSKADPSHASLDWSAIQTLFEKANFDALLLLDCCAAASAAPTPSLGSSVTETIAAAASKVSLLSLADSRLRIH